MLRVWLPLTKDLRQQGLDNTSTITLASGNAFVDGGKVGNKALHLTKQQTILGTSSCMSGKKQMSYAFWVKVNTAWSAQWLDGIAWYSTDGSSSAYSRQEFYTNCTRIGTWFSGSSLSGYVFTPGEWTHIAGTFDYTAGIAKFYINGVLQGTSTSLSKTHYCRGDFYIGDSGVDIVENDVRIYDHALSQMEVKELAKGLVLHYPLNRQGWGQENLAIGTNIASSTNGKGYNLSSTIPSGTKVTISCWVDADNIIMSGNKRIGLSIGITKTDGSGTQWFETWASYNGGQLKDNGSFHGRVSNTQTILGNMSSIGTYIQTLSSGTVSVSQLKVEIGDGPTPWCPNSADALATTMGLNSTTEYDCSGFCNNGTRTGTFSWTSDTPKYNVSTKFNGSEKIVIPLQCGNFSEAFTASIWGYESDWNTASAERLFGAATSSSGWCIGDYGSENTLFACYTNGSFNTAYGFKQLSAGWHHFVITFDGLHIVYYVDGEVFNSKTFSSKQIIGGTYNIHVGSHYGGSCPFKGKLCDARIYATALSADDVKSLYQNSAYIDSSGNVYGAVHSEV